ncbi:uncharacterized protein TRAVEDRAFT_61247 [Trametes versicolor FP-101664 SS1]|uniref:uncharacterized protein n=1 Tax=Trametes versicolor (strain FP-101664) TaxID=717944 RepID=UPI0004621BFC|nr:uncharacterized protein TRAVEDRAFT_61247 [Trametes versicolor FP-101664 SS1]EIW53133.1 hypothetical protein TRAVEDRAFT_61247 [Trametes versicolor FP-101664 SS1]
MNSTLTPDAIIASVQEFLIQDYGAVSAAVLLLWHYVLTFDKEVTFFWGRVFSGPSALFFANRYLTLAVALYDAPLWSYSTVYARCAAAIRLLYVLEILQYVIWAAFSCLRVYALQSGRWKVAAFVLLLSLVPVAVYSTREGFSRVYIDPAVGCDVEDRIAYKLFKMLDLASRVSLVAAEGIVFVVTWRETRDCVHELDVLRVHAPRGRTLSSVFYENSGIYFAFLTLLNAIYAALLLLSMTCEDCAVARATPAFDVFMEPLTALTFTHFLINLQEAARGETVMELSMVEFAVSVENDSINEDRARNTMSGVSAVSSPGTHDLVRADGNNWAMSEHA